MVTDIFTSDCISSNLDLQNGVSLPSDCHVKSVEVTFGHLPFRAAIFIREVNNILTHACFSFNQDLQNGLSHYTDLFLFLGRWPPPLPLG